MNSGFRVQTEEVQSIKKWVESLGNTSKGRINVASWSQSWGQLNMSKSVLDTPLCLKGKKYEWGLGTHADSEIVLRCNKPISAFHSFVGLDHNRDTIDGDEKITFSIWCGGNKLIQSEAINVNSIPPRLEVSIEGATEIVLKVHASNPLNVTHADWAEPEITTIDGEILQVGVIDMACANKTVPISFKYNGIDSEEWFSKSGISYVSTRNKKFITHKYVCDDKDTGLECTVELQEYEKFPACIWNVYFKNNGKKVTPILEDIKTLDLKRSASQQRLLQRARGSFNYQNGISRAETFRDNFELLEEDLWAHPEIVMAGVGGRPSVDWMPYFNFVGQSEGLMFGIGWTGQWKSLIKSERDYIHFQAGMERIRTVLMPGESIRQPSIMMLYWQGDNPIRGNNLLRRFMMEEILPRDAQDKTMTAPACYSTWGGMVESSHLTRIKTILDEKIPIDYYWIDAGWYGKAGPNDGVFTPEWGLQVGDWSVNQETYPHEFKEISSALHKNGRKFLLWFEPERAMFGTPVTQEHPDWFLGLKTKRNNLSLNLGSIEALKWCVELISGLIKEQGIDCYRQDFNYSPLSYWQANDTPDRIGMTEIRHIEGLYTFLDELRRRFPNLLIDNCASGGRRLDFEMMRRSTPLWPSDMQCFPDYITERNQQQMQGLSMWLPQFSFGTQNHVGDTYHFRSTMAAGIVVCNFSCKNDDQGSAYQWLRDRLDEYHRAKVYFAGDFYPLLQQSDSFETWSAYQLDRPDLGSGILEVFRKSQSPIEKILFTLQGLDSSATYEIEDADSKDIIKILGKELLEEGLPVKIENKRESRLYFYNEI